jgi:hypothetical protein
MRFSIPRLRPRASLAAAVLLVAASADARAGFIDLTTSGATSAPGTVAAIGGTNWFVQQGDIQPSGTGVFDPFLTIQRIGAEQGFNTGVSPTDYDTKRIANPANPGDGWTRAVQLGSLQVNANGYYVFKLDINEPQAGQNSLLSLNQMQIFLSAADLGTPGTYSVATANNKAPVLSFSSGSPSEVFRLNDQVANYSEIKLDSGLSHGSGSSDMFLYVKASLFAGGTASSYLTFYSQFGDPPGTYGANGGFEEWAFQGGRARDFLEPSPAPPSALLALIGLASAGFGGFLRRRHLSVAG